MNVFFPHGGRWRMLRWYEHGCGHHLILARSHRGVMSALRTVLEKKPDAELRGYWEINVWAPSQAMCDMAREHEELEARELFEARELKESPVEKRLVKSAAPPPPIDVSLMVARVDFGHHQTGVSLDVFELAPWMLRNVLFFYSLSSQVPGDEREAEALVGVRRSEAMAQKERETLAWIEARKRKDSENLAAFMRLLRGP